jgi:hypothetical protein
VNTALPTIETRLHAGFTGVQWWSMHTRCRSPRCC